MSTCSENHYECCGSTHFKHKQNVARPHAAGESLECSDQRCKAVEKFGEEGRGGGGARAGGRARPTWAAAGANLSRSSAALRAATHSDSGGDLLLKLITPTVLWRTCVQWVCHHTAGGGD